MQAIGQLREREKRRSSVVIKGLSARSPDAIAGLEFGELTSQMMGSRVTLIDIARIKDHRDL